MAGDHTHAAVSAAPTVPTATRQLCSRGLIHNWPLQWAAALPGAAAQVPPLHKVHKATSTLSTSQLAAMSGPSPGRPGGQWLRLERAAGKQAQPGATPCRRAACSNKHTPLGTAAHASPSVHGCMHAQLAPDPPSRQHSLTPSATAALQPSSMLVKVQRPSAVGIWVAQSPQWSTIQRSC